MIFSATERSHSPAGASINITYFDNATNFEHVSLIMMMMDMMMMMMVIMIIMIIMMMMTAVVKGKFWFWQIDKGRTFRNPWQFCINFGCALFCSTLSSSSSTFLSLWWFWWQSSSSESQNVMEATMMSCKGKSLDDIAEFDVMYCNVMWQCKENLLMTLLSMTAMALMILSHWWVSI